MFKGEKISLLICSSSGAAIKLCSDLRQPFVSFLNKQSGGLCSRFFSLVLSGAAFCANLGKKRPYTVHELKNYFSPVTMCVVVLSRVLYPAYGEKLKSTVV